MKTFKTKLLTIAVLLCSISASAYDFYVDEIYYNITSETDLIASVTRPYIPGGYSGVKVIPTTVNYKEKTYSVTSIESFAFSSCNGLTSITIPNSVTSIGQDAFSGCNGLKEVHIDDLAAWCNIPFHLSSTNPLYYAHHLYLNGEEITNLIIPNNVTSIGYNAFGGCTGLTSITIPNSVTSIDAMAFHGCTDLASISVESGNTIYDSRENCNAILETGTNTLIFGCKKTSIPNSVTNIGSEAFYGCTSLTSITIPNSVTSIGGRTFYDCTSLTSITIPNSVTNIGTWAFRGCTSLANIIVDEENCVYNSKDNCNAVIETNSNTLIIGCKSTVIPNFVTSIGDHAFRDCASLSSIIIPSSVISISKSAFSNCKGLKTVINLSELNITKGASSYGNVARYANRVINADEQVENLFFKTENNKHYLCWYMGNDKDLSLPDNYKGGTYAIIDSAFFDCNSLLNVIIPNSVTSIGNSAFMGCTSLTTVTMETSTPPTLGTLVFDNTTIVLRIPKGSLLAYQTAEGWKEFENIEEYDYVPDSIHPVLIQREADATAPIYNLQGIQMKNVESLPAGIYVVNGKKFIIK